MGTHRRTTIGILIASIFLPVLAVSAEEAPDRGKAPDNTQPAEAIQAPALTGVIPPQTPLKGAPELQRPIPVDPLDRGSSLTDGAAAGALIALNILERAKLDMAREAIEASRLAGTLMTPWPGPVPAPRPADIEAIKLEALRNATPQTPPAQAGADGVGGGLESVQEIGDGTPTEAELAKLQRSWPATPNTNVPELPAKPVAPAAAPENREVR